MLSQVNTKTADHSFHFQLFSFSRSPNSRSVFEFGTVTAFWQACTEHAQSCERAMRTSIGATLRSRAFRPTKPSLTASSPSIGRIRTVNDSKRFSHGKDSRSICRLFCRWANGPKRHHWLMLMTRLKSFVLILTCYGVVYFFKWDYSIELWMLDFYEPW